MHGGCFGCFSGLLGALGVPGVRRAPSSVRVAAVQCSSQMGSADAIEENADKMERLARRAAAKGAQIIVFPEAALTGYTSQPFLHNWHTPQRKLAPRFAGINPAKVVPTVDSPIVRRFVDLAQELGVYLTIPFVEEVLHPSRHFFNTVCLASPGGKIVVHYRKTHLWDFVDGSWADRGDGPGIYDSEFGRIGLGICFDIHRLAELYKGKDLWALLYSVAWVGHRTDGPTERWFRKDLPETYLGTEGGLPCFVVAANWSTEREYSWDGAGYSSIYGPDGQRLAFLDLEIGDNILYQDIPCRP
ncbi:unnamed protein product [Effrenium voratum]|nr:unnamed protein product [Effrenium voratum]